MTDLKIEHPHLNLPAINAIQSNFTGLSHT